MSNTINISEKKPWYHEINSQQWRAFFAAFMGWALDAMDAMLYSMIIVMIMKEFKLNTAQAGLLASITFLAAGFGSWFFGVIADRIGRTKAMIAGILLYSVGTGLCGLSQNLVQLGIFRVIVGLGVGGEWATGAALVSETWPAKYRSKVLAFLQSGFAFGVAAAAIITALVIPYFGWRGVFFVGVLPAFFTLFIRLGVKEPESWQQLKEEQKTKTDVKNPFIELWDKKFIIATIGIGLYGALSLFGYYGVFTWLPGYLGTPVDKGGAGMSIIKSSYWIAIIQIGAFLGYNFFGYVADWIGRRWSTILYLVGVAIIIPIFTSIRDETTILFVGCILAFLGHGYVAGFGLIAGELYPVRMRATASGFIYGCGRWASGVAPYVVGYLALKYKLGGAFLASSGAFILAALVVLFLIKETKGTLLEHEQGVNV